MTDVVDVSKQNQVLRICRKCILFMSRVRAFREEQVRGVEWHSLLPDLCDVAVERRRSVDDVPAAGAGLSRRHFALRRQDLSPRMG